MFTVRNFFICVIIFVTFIASIWFGFRRTNSPAQVYENGVDMYAPYYQDPAISTPIGGITDEKHVEIPTGKGEEEMEHSEEHKEEQHKEEHK